MLIRASADRGIVTNPTAFVAGLYDQDMTLRAVGAGRHSPTSTTKPRRSPAAHPACAPRPSSQERPLRGVRCWPQPTSGGRCRSRRRRCPGWPGPGSPGSCSTGSSPSTGSARAPPDTTHGRAGSAEPRRHQPRNGRGTGPRSIGPRWTGARRHCRPGRGSCRPRRRRPARRRTEPADHSAVYRRRRAVTDRIGSGVMARIGPLGRRAVSAGPQHSAALGGRELGFGQRSAGRSDVAVSQDLRGNMDGQTVGDGLGSEHGAGALRDSRTRGRPVEKVTALARRRNESWPAPDNTGRWL
jgi:hypothetical protein